MEESHGHHLERYKAFLVAKGYVQKLDIGFNEIFSPFVKLTIVWVLFSLVGTQDLELERLDAKIVFSHGDLEEEIYMDQPEGYKEIGK